MLKNYLNVRYSLRKISDQDFENILPQLANELEQVSFIPYFEDKVLKNDWEKIMCLAINQ